MLDRNTDRDELKAGVGAYGRLSPETVRSYVGLSSAGAKKDVLGAKMRELIALEVAVAQRCDGCITIHTEQALKHGASEEEIAEALGVAVALGVAEALGVAVALGAGASLVYSTRVMDAVAAYHTIEA
ncbi:alkylhydroperoxidase AhpD core [Stappia sp. 22II-S9-Z10]|nr:alkylhydroperoxidase AhpD core [Stappia sp. 22II-S9-Z10]